ncbi:thioredoxin family protein [Flavobacterium sp. ANB]|uniref:protein-disulfide reductase DsbD family protein n=1 Tax=unclassified Flavobacterium TaxID=196869 RepID=UPI0012B8A5BE|nr:MULTISPECIES: thioredoxin family protein [unclassified Flavobacterium]MBF4516862.1 thioredoxin family protein [Flavobacterium sp. ANB]MTD69242.1 thiol:disulfide interchange protein [Flavobacterium sp. LC2016-13]
MKKIFLIVAIFFAIHNLTAQIYDPVSFKTSVKVLDSNNYELIITAQIEKGWHMYSQKVPANGPMPTSFVFSKSKNYTAKGGVIEPTGHEIDDPVFGIRIRLFETKAVFTQKIKRKNNEAFRVNATIEFMVCNDQSCLPPSERDFVFEIPKSDVKQETKVIAEVEKTDTIATVKEDTVKTEVPVKTEIKKDNAVTKNTDKPKDQNIWSVFILSFLGGLAALLTPCVFPMIPMTVSFFTKQSKNKAAGIRNALLYGCFIIIIYVALGTLVTTIFGADALNALATNVFFNLIFFGLLVVFAVSFLGAFEIVLPSSWLTKVDNNSQKSGVIGIFFMALALAIVSFSCTGPIVGTLLVQSASQGGLAPIIGMFGFSLAISLPFTLFAAFPGWMNSLPKSGGWLNSVKVVLGFLELALAFKFLSNADLVLQLHLLERETFLAIWIAIFSALTLYLFGKIQLSHDSPVTHLSVGRLSFGIVVLAFTIYLIPGLWGAPLQWISGFPPPKQYSESPNGIGMSATTNSTEALPEGAEEGPQGITVFRDYETGLAYAKKVNKPVMLDFTGFACVNCRKMEERVWPDPQVLSQLKNDVIVISLYVDDKRPLAENEQIISKISGKKLKYIGQKWSEFQILKYKTNAQPYYVLIDHKGENLNMPTAYNPNIEFYTNWLKEGVGNFKK